MLYINLGGTAEVFYSFCPFLEGQKLFLYLNQEGNMKTQTFEEIESLLENYSMIPICKEIYADIITPISLLRKMEVFGKNFFRER